ncbi:MAG: hypothetical protein LBO80_07125 [Treponema sp.]|nr:hypothetical protein [Treponema sp.]
MIPLLAAALGPALVLFISEGFRYFHAKREREERFFYEVYPKRLALYEDILVEINFMKTMQYTNAVHLKKMAGKIYQLEFRSVLYGQSAVTDALGELATLYDKLYKLVEAGVYPLGTPLHLPIERLPILHTRILEFIREESGKYVVDKKIFEFLAHFEAEQHKQDKKPGRRRDPKNKDYSRYSY